jgi:GTPase SAR1 family protein
MSRPIKIPVPSRPLATDPSPTEPPEGASYDENATFITTFQRASSNVSLNSHHELLGDFALKRTRSSVKNSTGSLKDTVEPVSVELDTHNYHRQVSSPRHPKALSVEMQSRPHKLHQSTSRGDLSAQDTKRSRNKVRKEQDREKNSARRRKLKATGDMSDYDESDDDDASSMYDDDGDNEKEDDFNTDMLEENELETHPDGDVDLRQQFLSSRYITSVRSLPNTIIDESQVDKSTQVYLNPPIREDGCDSTDHTTSKPFSNGHLLRGRSSSVFQAERRNSVIPCVREECNPCGDGDQDDMSRASDNQVLCRRRKVSLIIDQCETVKNKRKLILSNMHLTNMDIPVEYLCCPKRNDLHETLHKLSLSGNRLISIPKQLVYGLRGLRTLDLSKCELRSLPSIWDLPHLKRLDLSNNKLEEFPSDEVLQGIPMLQTLDLYGNQICELILPQDPNVLSHLMTLNIGFNKLASLPEDLANLKSLRFLKVMNNLIEKVPFQLCEMNLELLDVTSNPLVQPPIETCERGIGAMKRYYQLLRSEEEKKAAAAETLKRKELARERKAERLQRRLTRRRGVSICSSPVPSEPTTASAFPEKPTISDTTDFSLGEAQQKTVAYTQLSTQPIPLGIGRTTSLQYQPKAKIMDIDSRRNSYPLHAEKVRDSNTSPSQSYYETDDLVAESRSDIDTDLLRKTEEVTLNDTLKITFVGQAMSGKTTIIRRLIEGPNAVIPKEKDRTIGVDIYQWSPAEYIIEDRQNIDTHIKVDDEIRITKPVDIKFSVWDFAGQHVYHTTHELFFSKRSLYVVVWDMGVSNKDTFKKVRVKDEDRGPFKLSYDSSDSDENDDVDSDDDEKAEKALKRNIDENVQFWIDCIQSSVPGAAIMVVASFDDYFGNNEEPKRRCDMMKSRLRENEQRRINGLKEKLDALLSSNAAGDETIDRIQKLSSPMFRPKLLFGQDNEESVVRVSGSSYRGFDKLADKIVNISTGRDHGGFDYPIFRGHIGARIPRMRKEVREIVGELRDRFKIVEWNFFVKKCFERREVTSVDDICDALHFLTDIGELSFFGSLSEVPVIEADQKGSSQLTTITQASNAARQDGSNYDSDSDDELSNYEETLDAAEAENKYLPDIARLRLNRNLSSGTVTTDPSSTLSQDPQLFCDLSSYIFLNPRWLMDAVSCILRHDLSNKISETRRETLRELSESSRPIIESSRPDSFRNAESNCPLITSEDACMLWDARKHTKKAVERIKENSINEREEPYMFLQRLLTRFRVFVPIDLTIEKTQFGGTIYSLIENESAGVKEATDKPGGNIARFFFLPSLLGSEEPGDHIWTYRTSNADGWMRTSDAWKICICHSLYLYDGAPPGLTERILAAVLNEIYSISEKDFRTKHDDCDCASFTGIKVREVLCWRSSFCLTLGLQDEDGESKVEIFGLLADKGTSRCIASDSMAVGSQRLILSARGEAGASGRKIWCGGYRAVLRTVGLVIKSEYRGLAYEHQTICPECLAKRPYSKAEYWNCDKLCPIAKKGTDTIRCKQGHYVDIRLVTGTLCPVKKIPTPPVESLPLERIPSSIKITSGADVPVANIIQAVVLVGLWDGSKKVRRITHVGSGFIVDKKRGLIVTAAHTLINIGNTRDKTDFGKDVFGKNAGRIVIGVIPRSKNQDEVTDTGAVFRYFARILVKDETMLLRHYCKVDVCVLQIMSKMEKDELHGVDLDEQPEIVLRHNEDLMKKEKLLSLKVSQHPCELEENIKILGYEQGGDGIMPPGARINRFCAFGKGYICQLPYQLHNDDENIGRMVFKPSSEIVAICPTIQGQSGGPCVNLQGEVIGILCRMDLNESQRCYISPASEWISLVVKAKSRS